MTASTMEANLLLGVLALRLGLVSPDALASALRSWVRDRSHSLAGWLVQQQSLTEDELRLLDSLAGAHLRRHENDSVRSLASLLAPGSIPAVLLQIDHPELQLLLERLDRGGPSARTECQVLNTSTVDLPITTGETPTLPAGPGQSGRPPAAQETPAASRYRVLRRHARGGLGEIFVAQDRELQREVALKEMQAQHLHRPENRQRFLLEGEVTGRLEHPGIVPVYGLGVYADGRPFYVMRFIRGESLSSAIARFHGGTPVSPGERALELRKLLVRFLEVCNAIAYAHSRGVLHRDLKPDNIMLGDFGETLVVDWGLAKTAGQVFHPSPVSRATPGSERDNRADDTPDPDEPIASENSAQSLLGQVIGTPQYMSPEQAAGRPDLLGPASDVYSLGATLYTILTGERPFPLDADVMRVLRLVQSGSFPPPRELNRGVPKPLEAICLKAMALKPEDRYSSTRDLAADIERWLADEPVSSYREPIIVRLRRWARRHRTMVTAASVLAVAAVLGLVVVHAATRQAYELLREEEKRTREAIHQRALAQADALLEAGPQAVPALLEALAPSRDQVRFRLREVRDRPAPARPAQMAEHRRRQIRASLALLAEDPGEVAFLRRKLLSPLLEPEECLLLRDALKPHRKELIDELWQQTDRLDIGSEQRFRALVALAEFDPDNPRWEEHGHQVVGPLLAADPLHVGIWTAALRPVRDHLIGPLSEVFTDPVLPAERRVAATVLREYVEDRPGQLISLLADADEAQIALLLPRVQAQGKSLLPRIHEALARAAQPGDTEEKRDSQARRQANLAAVLVHLGDPEPAWKLLQHGPYPDARSRLIHLFAGVDIDPGLLIHRLREESDVSVKRALVKALGSFSPDQLPPARRAEIVPRLLSWYREDPDPGLHSAIDWLLRHGRDGPSSRKLDWDQAEALERIDRELQGQPPGRKRWYVTPGGQTMVLLGPCTFDMGSPADEPGHDSDEAQHRRRIARTYAVSSREVTVRQFQGFLKAHPEVKHWMPPGYAPEPDCAVVNITWLEAAQFCRWLSEQEKIPEDQMCFPSVAEIEKSKDGKTPLKLPPNYLSRTGYRLPTEAEWEYACRAGSKTSRPSGVSPELITHYAWDARHALHRTWPVGQKKPNDFGLYDMFGNVAEWCLNQYTNRYPQVKEGEAADDPETLTAVNADTRMILRGAPFYPRLGPLRSAFRYWHLATDRFSTVGLRVVRTVPAK